MTEDQKKALIEWKREHKTISYELNTFVEAMKVEGSVLKRERDGAKDAVKSVISRFKTDIQKKEELEAKFHYNGSNDRSDGGMREDLKILSNGVRNFIGVAMFRQEALSKLINEYSDLNEWSMKCDQAMLKAEWEFKFRVKSNQIGWGNTAEVVVGTPGSLTLTEVADGSSYSGVVRYKWQAKFGVDGTWLDKVYEKGIQTCDIAGKQCITLDADVVAEHELLNEDVVIYKAKVGYTKVPQGLGYVSEKGEAWKVCFVEDKYIAVQTLPSGEKQMATGKDLSWAIRTMKMRMKANMLKQMGLK